MKPTTLVAVILRLLPALAGCGTDADFTKLALADRESDDGSHEPTLVGPIWSPHPGAGIDVGEGSSIGGGTRLGDESPPNWATPSVAGGVVSNLQPPPVDADIPRGERFPGGVALALPQLKIATDGNEAITSKEVYLNAELSLIGSQDFGSYFGTTEIRGRGHTTWDRPKKPYRIKLTEKASLLGMPESRHWVLLASFIDKTLLRTDAVFDLSEAMGFVYTPRHAYVELNLNGQYEGIYELVELVRVASSRVDIPELKVEETSSDLITGGYLIEVDARRGEDFCMDSEHTSMVFCLVSPETLLEPDWAAPRQYIENYIRQVEDAIFAEDFANPETGYAAFLDVDSAVSYYLVNELTKNIDGDLRLSTFLHKPRNGKLTFGPLWDFDIAIGNTRLLTGGDADGWYVRNAPWFARMFKDPAFAQRVTERWQQMKANGVLDRLLARVDARALWLSEVQCANYERWYARSPSVSAEVATAAYEGEVTDLKVWLQARIGWMDAQLSP